MRETRTSGLMSGDGKRGDANLAQATAPVLNSTLLILMLRPRGAPWPSTWSGWRYALDHRGRLEAAKGDPGLDQYEVRSWTGWHRARDLRPRWWMPTSPSCAGRPSGERRSL